MGWPGAAAGWRLPDRVLSERQRAEIARRAMMSAPPPGAKPTRTLTGGLLVAGVCPHSSAGTSSSANAYASARMIIRFMAFSLAGRPCHVSMACHSAVRTALRGACCSLAEIKVHDYAGASIGSSAPCR